MALIKCIQNLLLAVIVMSFTGCATIKLGTVPPPKDTSQLRVALYAVSGLIPNGSWGSTPEEFRQWHDKTMGRLLKNYGAYQVVSNQEVRAVLGQEDPDGWQLSRNNWELGLNFGKALHADYVLVSYRGTMGDPHYFYEVTLLNVASGAKYAVRINNIREMKPNSPKLPPGAGRIAYRELFDDAKGDLLSTALRKSRQLQGDTNVDEPAIRRLAESRAAELKLQEQAPRQVQYKDAEKNREPVKGQKKLIVYDISTSDSLQVVALILSEALREEIIRRGNFNLVNRENIAQLFEELKFQQSGPVDPTQAVKLGKGAGANEIVTSKLGSIGKILMLQSKRVDVESMLNLSAASLKGQPGQEDELLKELPGLVDRLLYGK